MEVSSALEMYIESYSHSTSQLNAMAGALFAGSAFLAVRAAGVINDKSVPNQKWPWLPVVVMVLAAVSMMLGYFVYGQTAFFYSSIYQFELTGFVFPFEEGSRCYTIANAQAFFDECIRKNSLSTTYGLQLGSVFLSGVLMMVWLGLNTGARK